VSTAAYDLYVESATFFIEQPKSRKRQEMYEYSAAVLAIVPKHYHTVLPTRRRAQASILPEKKLSGNNYHISTIRH